MGRRPAGQGLSPTLTAEIRELLELGLSKKAIARRLGVSAMTVYRCLGTGRDRRLRPSRAGAGAGTRRGRACPGSGRAEARRTGVHSGAAPPSNAPVGRRRHAATRLRDDGDGYPEALLRRVPRDYLAMLPNGHYQALVRAAVRTTTVAAVRSLRQALLLHGEPRIPPPTSIELSLSKEEEEELRFGSKLAGST